MSRKTRTRAGAAETKRGAWIPFRAAKVMIAALALVHAAPGTAISPIYFSRANCGNNESITWDPTQAPYHQITAISYHAWSSGGKAHAISDARTMDNAAKAVHWGEGLNMPLGDYWIVTGIHTWSSGEWWMGIFSISGQSYSQAIDC